jgi:hypothetical protein
MAATLKLAPSACTGIAYPTVSPAGPADSSGKWCGNALRFATLEEAEANVQDLMMRWFAVRETRVIESDDPVNYRYIDGRLENLAPEETIPAK